MGFMRGRVAGGADAFAAARPARGAGGSAARQQRWAGGGEEYLKKNNNTYRVQIYCFYFVLLQSEKFAMFPTKNR